MKSKTPPFHPFSVSAFQRFSFFFALFAAAFLSVPPASAQNRTWDGGSGSDNNWSSAANWDAALVANDALIFAGATRLNPNNDTTANTTYNGITFNNTAGAFTLGGNSITLNGSVTNNDTDLQTINLNMIVNAQREIATTSGNIAIGGAIGGAGGITKLGNGTLTLSGNNTYSGLTTVRGGSIVIGA